MAAYWKSHYFGYRQQNRRDKMQKQSTEEEIMESAHRRCSFLQMVMWIPAILIMASVWYSYYAFVVELCIFTIKSTVEKVVYLVIYHLIFLLFFWSYWRTLFSSPAAPSTEFCLSESDKEQYEKEETPEVKQEILRRAAKDLPIYTTLTDDIWYCDRCQLIKPDRCHHCSVCDMCVLKKDHHCPWLNNCIGFSNYKFFLLFLAYGCLYCLFVASTTFQYFLLLWKGKMESRGKIQIEIMFFMAPVFFSSLIILLFCHCCLVGTNTTTIESSQIVSPYDGKKNRFSLGFRKNVREVFGDQKMYWLFPIFTSLGDGCSFPTCDVSGEP